jgi:hypothetical protein
MISENLEEDAGAKLGRGMLSEGSTTLGEIIFKCPSIRPGAAAGDAMFEKIETNPKAKTNFSVDDIGSKKAG